MKDNNLMKNPRMTKINKFNKDNRVKSMKNSKSKLRHNNRSNRTKLNRPTRMATLISSKTTSTRFQHSLKLQRNHFYSWMKKIRKQNKPSKSCVFNTYPQNNKSRPLLNKNQTSKNRKQLYKNKTNNFMNKLRPTRRLAT